jgi:uncharacterized protein YciI
MMRIALVLLMLILSISLLAQQKIDKDFVGLQVMQGHPYTLMILKPTGYLPKDSFNDWSMMHLINLFQMHADGKSSVFGPVTDPKADVGGIIIFNTTDTVQIKSWMAKDPLVSNNIFTYKLYPWFSVPDQKLLPTIKPK